MPYRLEPVIRPVAANTAGPTMEENLPDTLKNPKNSAVRSAGTRRLNKERATAWLPP
ncbi:hypothetical protein D3C71_2106440 [compost metagenome]